jgi:hypothetical protein
MGELMNNIILETTDSSLRDVKSSTRNKPIDAENFFTDTCIASRKKGGIEPGPVYSILPAVLSAQPVLQLFPWEA